MSQAPASVRVMSRAVAVLGALGPPRCAGCGRRQAIVCDRCRDRLGRAADRPSPAPAQRLVCALDYDGPARSLVLDLKLRGRIGAAAPLADALAAAVARSGLAADVLTWVPGRRRDIARRGFDHAEALARALTTRLGIDARPLLTRTTPRPDQSTLAAAERRASAAGAFAAVPVDRRVAVVDDLITTGATAAACARALLDAGAAGVEIVAACSAT